MMTGRSPQGLHGFDIKSEPYQEQKESAFGVSTIKQGMNLSPLVPFPPFA